MDPAAAIVATLKFIVLAAFTFVVSCALFLFGAFLFSTTQQHHPHGFGPVADAIFITVWLAPVWMLAWLVWLVLWVRRSRRLARNAGRTAWDNLK